MERLFAIFLVMSILTPAFGQEPVDSKDAIKADYILHLLNFTRWEDHTKGDYYVCVPDDESLKLALEETFQGKTINNRNVAVIHQAEFCHILISDDPPYSTNTLTIGPLYKGALLEFRLVHNKLKFAIDLDRIRRSKLKISSQLLKLAILDSR